MKDSNNCILLIDDHEPTNFLNKFLLQEDGFAAKVVTTENGREALDYLERVSNNQADRPDLILLDLNMPVMDGWQFLEAYQKIDPSVHSSKLLLMLTTALTPAHEQRLKDFPEVDGAIAKPLELAALKKEVFL